MEFIDGEDLASLIRRIGHLTNDNPPMSLTGEARIYTTLDGRLRRLEIPPRTADALGSAEPPNWSALFSDAGLDISKFNPSNSPWKPFFY